MKTTYQAPALGVTFIGDGAGIHHTNIGGIIALAIGVADSLEALSHKFGFVLIDFATKSCHTKFRAHAFLSILNPKTLANWFDRRRHAAFAAWDQVVFAESMDLISFEFSVFHGRGHANGTT